MAILWELKNGQWTYRGTPATAVTTSGTQQQARYQQAVSSLAPYQQGGGYDLIKAVEAGVSRDTLKQAGFKDEDIQRAWNLRTPQLRATQSRYEYEIYRKDLAKQLDLKPTEKVVGANLATRMVYIQDSAILTAMPGGASAMGFQGGAAVATRTAPMPEAYYLYIVGQSGEPRETTIAPSVITPETAIADLAKEWGGPIPGERAELDPNSPTYKARQEISQYYDQKAGGYGVLRARLGGISEETLLTAGIGGGAITEADRIIAEAKAEEAKGAARDEAVARVMAGRSQYGTSIGAATGERPMSLAEGWQANLDAWYEGIRTEQPYSPISLRWRGPSQYKLESASLGSRMGRFAAGAILTLPMMALGTVTMVGRVIENPAAVLPVAKEIGQGLIQTVSNLNPKVIVDPFDRAAAITIVLLWKEPITKAIKKTVAYLEPTTLPAELIGKELQTGRIAPVKGFELQTERALTEVMRQSMQPGAPKSVVVPIEGTNWQLRGLTSPIQRELGQVLWHGSNKGLEFLGKTGEFAAGEAGWYNSPLAALDYTKGGEGKPALVMTFTDAAKVRDMKAGVRTVSDKPYRTASEGLYGPAKVWRGDLETEIVASPGTKFVIPEAKSSLNSRVLTGEAADFAVYYDGKYIPVKIAIDKAIVAEGVVRSAPTPVEIYAVKLRTLENSLQNLQAAVTHPYETMQDIIRTARGITELPEALIREGEPSPARLTPLGVRDVYMEYNWAARLKQLAAQLKARMLEILRDERGEVTPERLREVLDRAYAEQANRLLQSSGRLAALYEQSPELREKFEEAYTVHLGDSVEALVRSSSIETTASREVVEDIRSRPSDGRVLSPPSPLARESELVGYPYEPSREPPREIPPESEPPRREIISPPIEPRLSTPERPPTSEIILPLEIPRRVPPSPIPSSEIPDEWKATGVPAGTLEHRQGKKWVAIPPPYRDEDKLWLDKPLPGTYKFATGKGSAYKTLQVIGGPPPKDADIDMGWAKVHISSKGKDLTMTFAGGQEAANERWTAEREAMDEMAKQSYAEMPNGQIAERIPRETVRRETTRAVAYDVDLAELEAQRDILDARIEEERGVHTHQNDRIYQPSRKREGKVELLLTPRYYLGRRLRDADLGGGL